MLADFIYKGFFPIEFCFHVDKWYFVILLSTIYIIASQIISHIICSFEYLPFQELS